MPKELVVRELFGLGTKLYQRGDHITDVAEIAAVEADRKQFVRPINAPDAKAVAEPIEPALEPAKVEG
jgi:calcineurin-like phosphoesterase